MTEARRILDDVARVATGAVGIIQGAGREAEELFRQRLERVLDKMDLVTRDEFDAVRAMALKAREENEALAAELAALKAAVAPKRGAATGTGAKKAKPAATRAKTTRAKASEAKAGRTKAAGAKKAGPAAAKTKTE